MTNILHTSYDSRWLELGNHFSPWVWRKNEALHARALIGMSATWAMINVAKMNHAHIRSIRLPRSLARAINKT
jgi:hypothetical protein